MMSWREKLGIDRLEFRLKNALRNGSETVTGQRLDSGVGIVRLPGSAEAALVARACRRRSVQRRTRRQDRRGVGVASCWYGCGNTSLPNPSTIKLGLSATGEVVLHQGAVDIGQGSNTVIAQICADALGLPLEKFRLRSADTAITPDAGKTSASRQTFVSGKAAEKAAGRLRENILRFANVSENARLRLEGTCAGHPRGRGVGASTFPRLKSDADGFVFARRGDLRSADAAARRQGPGQALRASMAMARRSPSSRSI